MNTERPGTHDDLLEMKVMAGELLRAAVVVAPPDSVAFHPHCDCDPYGFAATGAAEALVHCWDLAQGSHHRWRPPTGCPHSPDAREPR